MDGSSGTMPMQQSSRHGVGRTGTVRKDGKARNHESVGDFGNDGAPFQYASMLCGHVVGLSQAPSVDTDEAEVEETGELVIETDEIAHCPETEIDKDGMTRGCTDVSIRHSQCLAIWEVESEQLSELARPDKGGSGTLVDSRDLREGHWDRCGAGHGRCAVAKVAGYHG